MYEVVLRKLAAKNLQKIDSRYKQRILDALVYLQTDPSIGKSLQGSLKGFFSLRVWPYRIIYTIHQRELIVLVVDIDHHQGVYK